jgi:hypothetical protein
MRIPTGGAGNTLPGDRGRYLLFLESPLVNGEGHYVHFSWKEESFCIRDFIQQRERRQEPGLTATDIWAGASDRIPCKGELYIPVENFEFWAKKLNELTASHKQGKGAGVWALLSSKFVSHTKKSKEVARSHGDELDVYRKFITFWSNGVGFNVIERTVGCSARYLGEPLLWVYPTYFQVAPQGKGNGHCKDVSNIKNRHFPGFRGKGVIKFDNSDFDWDRFEQFIAEVKHMVQGNEAIGSGVSAIQSPSPGR